MPVSDILAYLGLAGFIAWSMLERNFLFRGQQQEQSDASSDRGTYRLIALFWYIAMLYSILDAFWFRWTLMPAAWRAFRWVGAPLILLGLYIRFEARRTLGVNFSVNVQTSDTHRLVVTGIYRLIRHPAYLGMILLQLGIPLCLGSLAGFLVALLGGLPAALYRIHVEEQALRDWFGEAYNEYARQTRKLIPGVW